MYYVVASNILVRISSYLSWFTQDFFHLRIHLLLVHFVHDDDLRLYWAKINEIKHFNLWPIRSTWDLRHQNGRTHFCEFSNKSDFDRHSSLVSSFDFSLRAMRFLSSLFSTDLFTQFDKATGFYTLSHKRAPDLAWFNTYWRFGPFCFVLFSKFCLHPGAQHSTRSSVEIAQFTEHACSIK